MDSFRLRYPQVEALLAELHEVAPTGRVALMGRIKHLQRKGWPPGTNPGKGKAAEYDGGAVLKLLLAFELAALQMPPDQTIEFVESLDWSDLGEHFARVANELAEGLENGTDRMRKMLGRGAILVFNPDGLDLFRAGQPLSDPTLAQPPYVVSEDDDAANELASVLYMGRRFSALNLTKLLIHAALALEKIGGPDRTQFGKAVLSWIEGASGHD